MLYSIGCTYIMTANRPLKFYRDLVDHLELKVRFHLLDDDNCERYFETDKDIPETDGMIDMLDGTKRQISDLIGLYFEKDSGYMIVPDIELMHYCNGKASFTLEGFSMISAKDGEALDLPDDSVREFLKHNVNAFDIPENAPAKIKGYTTYVVEEPYIRSNYFVYADRLNNKAIATNERLAGDQYELFTSAKNMPLAEDYATALQAKLDSGETIDEVLRGIEETLKRGESD